MLREEAVALASTLTVVREDAIEVSVKEGSGVKEVNEAEDTPDAL